MRKNTSGFSVVELLIVIVVIGILSAITYVSYNKISSDSRDSRRASQATLISESLEKYYNKNGEYPSCNTMSQSPSSIASNALAGIDPTAFSTPSATSGTNSILPGCADLIDGSDSFAYIGDSSCVGSPTTTCTKYTFKYKDEADGTVVSISSRKAPIENLEAPLSSPVVSVTLNGANVLATISPVACFSGTVQYGISSRTNDGTWSTFTPWSTTLTDTQTANDGVKYGYKAQARCYSDASLISSAKIGSESTYIDPITTPSIPNVATSTSSNITTYSWDAANCAAGTTARYQYVYSIDYSGGYTSGTYTTSSLSTTYNTASEGYQYTINVQSQCFNSYATSPLSATGTTSYIRAVASPGTITFGITRTSSTQINLTFASSCSSGMLLDSRVDIWITSSYNGYTYWWNPSGLPGWWSDANGGVWNGNTFTYYGSSFYWIVTISGGNTFLSGMPWQSATEMRCRNQTTGRTSTSTGRVVSPTLYAP